MADGFITTLVKGFAQLLDDAELGTYRSDGSAYPDDNSETAIVDGGLPQTPDNVIALTAYAVGDSALLSDSIVGVQIRTRWTGEDPALVRDLKDSIFQYLQGKHDFELSTGVWVCLCTHNGGASLGQDQNARWEWSDNYYLKVHRPSTNRV